MSTNTERAAGESINGSQASQSQSASSPGVVTVHCETPDGEEFGCFELAPELFARLEAMAAKRSVSVERIMQEAVMVFLNRGAA